MTDPADDEINELLRMAFEGGFAEIVRQVVIRTTDSDVVEIQGHDDGTFEMWFARTTAGFTGEELSNLQTLFEVKELGIYGDPQLAGTESGTELEGHLHAVLKPDV